MSRLLLACALLAAAACAGAQSSTVPKREWDFRVFLDANEIGRHRFTLSAQDGALELRSEASFEVSVLFITVFRYDHEATERWKGDCLDSLVSRTRTNDDRETVRAGMHAGQLVVERTAGRDIHLGCVKSFAYWNPGILGARRLMNSQTGEVVPVTVTAKGEETLEVRGRRIRAQRHHLAAPPDIAIDLWYDGSEWVALESAAKGGRRLRYVRT